MEDYLITKQPNVVIKSEADYCDYITAVGETDPGVWKAEWEWCRRNEDHFTRHWLWIENRDTKENVRLIPNAAQLKFEEQTIYDESDNQSDIFEEIILKARKLGFSTRSMAMFYHACVFLENMKAFVLAHDSESGTGLFKTIQNFDIQLPTQLRPRAKYHNTKLIEYIESPYGHRLNTIFRVTTAGSKDVGRGLNSDKILLSEYSSYKYIPELAAGLGESVRHGAHVIKESTAKGFNDFYTECMAAKKGENDVKFHFYAWHDDPNYSTEIPKGVKFKLDDYLKGLKKEHDLTDRQLYWYDLKRRKPGMRKLIKQEYPSTIEEAFMQSGNCVFDLEKLQEWRHEAEDVKIRHEYYNGDIRIFKLPNKDKDTDGHYIHKYIMGIDSAKGDDITGDGGKSFQCFSIIDVENWEVVATCRTRMTPHVMCKISLRFAKMYNKALYAPESNLYGTIYVDYARNKARYKKIYKHKDHDSKERSKTKYGFPTTSKTRPLLISDMCEAIDENLIIMNDTRMIDEAMTFVNRDGKEQAQVGCTDDMLFSVMIPIYVAKRKRKMVFV